MVKSITVPLGTPIEAVVSGGTEWVGPMMKLPSAFAGGTEPSGNSFAVTKPGLFGSRVGGAGRSVGCAEGADWPNAGLISPGAIIKITTTRGAMLRQRGIAVMRLLRSILNFLILFVAEARGRTA